MDGLENNLLNRTFQKLFILVNFYPRGTKMPEEVRNLFKGVFGVLLIIIAVWFATSSLGKDWGQAAWDLIQGGIVLLVILIGLVLLLVGLSDLKNAE